MSRAGSNILFDEVLATACKDDRASLCSDVQPVSLCHLPVCGAKLSTYEHVSG